MKTRKWMVALSLVAIMGVAECERPPGPDTTGDQRRQNQEENKKLKCELTGNERSECEEYR